MIPNSDPTSVVAPGPDRATPTIRLTAAQYALLARLDGQNPPSHLGAEAIPEQAFAEAGLSLVARGFAAVGSDGETVDISAPLAEVVATACNPDRWLLVRVRGDAEGVIVVAIDADRAVVDQAVFPGVYAITGDTEARVRGRIESRLFELIEGGGVADDGAPLDVDVIPIVDGLPVFPAAWGAVVAVQLRAGSREDSGTGEPTGGTYRSFAIGDAGCFLLDEVDDGSGLRARAASAEQVRHTVVHVLDSCFTRSTAIPNQTGKMRGTL